MDNIGHRKNSSDQKHMYAKAMIIPLRYKGVNITSFSS